MVFLDILSYLAIIELPTLVYGQGETCTVANTEPCSSKTATYIDVLNACVTTSKGDADPMWRAKKKCYDDHHQSFLVEPNTEERLQAVADFARKQNVLQFWIGLMFTWNKNIAQFFWAKHGNALKEEMHHMFTGKVHRGACVKAVVGDKNISWESSRCGFWLEYICGATSALMPGKPKIAVHYDNWKTTELPGGFELNVTCEAMLSQKGDLRIVIVSNTGSHIFGSTHSEARYTESLKVDDDGLCKRHGVLKLKLKMRPSMSGGNLACVSYVHEAFHMCLDRDPYCDVAGVVRVLPGPPGAVCPLAEAKRCVNDRATHIDVLNECVLYQVNSEISWQEAVDHCHNKDSVLVEPQTMEKLSAIDLYATQHSIRRYWIGLSFDSNYTWSQHGNVLSKKMHERFGRGTRTGDCVVSIAKNLTWVAEDCDRDNLFICSVTSMHMPRRPKISTGNYAELTSNRIHTGSKLNIACEAMLSHKGNLRVVIFSNSDAKFFGFNETGVIYNENLLYDTDLVCKKHGVINVTMKVTQDMDGKTLACVSYIDDVIKMCSRSDRFCKIVGSIKVFPDTGLPGLLLVVFPWWTLLILVLIISASMMAMPKMVRRPLLDEGEGVGYQGYAEDAPSTQSAESNL